jgi:uncharacterized C2H2 Zn-finger protein
LSKINPGSNFNEDNDVRTAQPGGMQATNIIEPKIDDQHKVHCPLCDAVFSSKENYISHALSKHHSAELNCDKKTAPQNKPKSHQHKKTTIFLKFLLLLFFQHVANF